MKLNNVTANSVPNSVIVAISKRTDTSLVHIGWSDLYYIIKPYIDQTKGKIFNEIAFGET